MYKVIVDFTDLHDNRYAYHVGDSFPHEGMQVSEERFEELSTNKNRRGKPLIEKVDVSKKNVDTPEIDSTSAGEEISTDAVKTANMATIEKPEPPVEAKKKATPKKPKQTTKRAKKNAD